MTIIDFAKLINSCDIITDIQDYIHKFIEEHDENYNKQEVFDFINSLSSEKRTAFANKIGYCKIVCIEQIKSNNTDEYKKKVWFVQEILDKFATTYEEVASSRQKKLTSEETANKHNEEVFTELNNKYATISKLIDDADKKIDNSMKTIDNKMFSLLINTVAILGIFVAIAFTGFGVSAIFPQIDISTSIDNEECFLKNIFYLLFASLCCYNLLLLLVYFIFKLSRPISLSTDKDKDGASNELENSKENEFIKTVNLCPFLWIDGILAVATIASFIAIIVIW